MVADPQSLERLFLALADKTRLKLLGLMAAGPVTVGVMADRLGESQPKVSRHLAYMRESGIVTANRDGKWIYYEIDSPADADAEAVLNMVVATLSGKSLDLATPPENSGEVAKRDVYESSAEMYE